MEILDLNTKITTGKYSGKKISWIIENDIKYWKWARNSIFKHIDTNTFELGRFERFVKYGVVNFYKDINDDLNEYFISSWVFYFKSDVKFGEFFGEEELWFPDIPLSFIDAAEYNYFYNKKDYKIIFSTSNFGKIFLKRETFEKFLIDFDKDGYYKVKILSPKKILMQDLFDGYIEGEDYFVDIIDVEFLYDEL